jgi:hypothetical protein
MGQPYDNVFKENLETAAPTLLKLKLLGIEYDSVEDLPGDLQVTLERRPDFTKLIKKGEQEFVWHLEIQTANEPDRARYGLPDARILRHTFGQIPKRRAAVRDLYRSAKAARAAYIE